MKGSFLLLDLQPSRYQSLLNAVIHLFAGVGVLLLDLPALWCAGLLAAIVADYAVTGRMGWAGTLRCGADGHFEVQAGDEWLDAELSPETVVWPWLVVLHYRLAGAHRPVARVILPDSLDEEDFRRLRVWLKWRCAKSAIARHSA